MDNFPTIAIFTYPSEYAVLSHLLQQAGIRFFFENETMVSVLPFHSNAVGGIHLKVHQRDVTKAKEIINGLNYSHHLRIV